MSRGWYRNKYGHSLASKGIKSNGILEDISFEVKNINTQENKPVKQYPIWRHYSEFLPEIQERIDENIDGLRDMDLFDITCPSQYKLRELIERGERDGLIYKIVYMNPQDYIDSIEYGFGDGYEPDHIDFRLDEEKLKVLTERFISGKKACIPSLEYDVGYNRKKAIFTQEGHHRSQIAKMIGKKEIPVMVVYPKDLKMRKISSGKMTHYIQEEIDI